MRFNALLHLVATPVALLGSAAASPAAVPRGRFTARQDDVIPTPEENERAAQIKDVFTSAWEGYYTFAFPKDELRPVNRTFENNYNGWGLTVVDSLSTASIMGLQSIIDRSLEFIPTIDYTKDATDQLCSLFETNIRHLAGLLSAYDLLTGPLAYMVKNKTQADALLTQARTLADTIKFGFDTPTGIPSNNLYINNRTTDNATDNNIAQRGQSWLVNPCGAFSEPFPGLVGIEINITTGRFTHDWGGWYGGIDSFYEYLLKMFVYDPARFGYYRDRWVATAESSIRFLESHPTSRPDLTFLASHNGTRVKGYSEHLACFAGASFILGGLVLEERRYVDFGLKLVDGCEAIYNETLTGLGPDVFRWDPVRSNSSWPNQTVVPVAVPANQSAFYQRAGFYIDYDYNHDGGHGGGKYGLGPETLESFYYAFRATGDRAYQDYVWHAFGNLREFSAVVDYDDGNDGESDDGVPVGFSVLRDVNAAGGGGYGNYQPSFFLAETLKYAYLAHAPQAAVHVGGGLTPDAQDWVFNTEAHPMRVIR